MIDITTAKELWKDTVNIGEEILGDLECNAARTGLELLRTWEEIPKLLNAISYWASQEDGIPEWVSPHYEALKSAVDNFRDIGGSHECT